MSTSTSPSPTTTATTTGIDYGIAPWKVALIDERARRRGFRTDELPDVRQDLAPILAAFTLDAAKANGACERTVLTSVIDNQLTMQVRTRARRQQFHAAYAQAIGAQERARIERREVTHEVNADRASDVAQAIAGLPADIQVVAQGLMAGERLFGMAKRLGRTRYDLERAVERIRDHFQACGVDAWVRGA